MIAALFTAHPRPWTVVDEGQRATWHGATMSDPESDLYVIDGFGEVIANLGDGDDARLIADGLVALATAATVEPVEAKVLGCTSACGYVEHTGRLLLVDLLSQSVSPGDLSGYGGSVARWVETNGRAIDLPDAPLARSIIRAVSNAGYDIIDPLYAATEAALAAGDIDAREWVSKRACIIGAIGQAARSGARVAIVVNIPKALADICDADCDGLDGQVRVFSHPSEVPDGYTIVHFGDGPAR